MDGAQARNRCAAAKPGGFVCRDARDGRGSLGVSRGGALPGADLGESSKYSSEKLEGRGGERSHVNSTCTWVSRS